MGLVKFKGKSKQHQIDMTSFVRPKLCMCLLMDQMRDGVVLGRGELRHVLVQRQRDMHVKRRRASQMLIALCHDRFCDITKCTLIQKSIFCPKNQLDKNVNFLVHLKIWLFLHEKPFFGPFLVLFWYILCPFLVLFWFIYDFMSQNHLLG